MNSTLLQDVELSAADSKKGNPVAWGPLQPQSAAHIRRMSPNASRENQREFAERWGNCPQSSLLHSCYTKQQRMSIEAAKSERLLCIATTTVKKNSYSTNNTSVKTFRKYLVYNVSFAVYSVLRSVCADELRSGNLIMTWNSWFPSEIWYGGELWTSSQLSVDSSCQHNKWVCLVCWLGRQPKKYPKMKW